MSVENIFNSEPTMDDVYAWHKEEVYQSFGLTTLTAWPKGVVHLVGATLLWFPVVNRIVHAVSKSYFPKKTSEDPNIKKPILHYLMHPGIAEKLNNLESILSQRVIGQDGAVHSVCNAIRRMALRGNSTRPFESFMFLGPTGVGKTELAKAVNENWPSKKMPLNRFDMSEYKSIFSLSSLIGAPPGLIGYYNGGALTNALIKNPDGIFLFDEIEKAHPEILDILLQMFDDGRITDSSGKVIDCSKAIFIMTSNIGANAYDCPKEVRQPILDMALKKAFKPEFLNRIDEILYFNPLDDEAVFKKIVFSKVHLFKQAIEASLLNCVTLSWEDEVIAFLAREGLSPEYGARPLERLIEKSMKTLVINAVLNSHIIEGNHLHFKVQGDQIILEILEPTADTAFLDLQT